MQASPAKGPLKEGDPLGFRCLVDETLYDELTQFLVVPKACENQDLALAFVHYLDSELVREQLLSAGYGLPHKQGDQP